MQRPAADCGICLEGSPIAVFVSSGVCNLLLFVMHAQRSYDVPPTLHGPVPDEGLITSFSWLDTSVTRHQYWQVQFRTNGRDLLIRLPEQQTPSSSVHVINGYRKAFWRV